MGLRVIAQYTGDSTINELGIASKAKLNLIHCYRSMNYICRTMEENYGIPWMEFNFFGPTKTFDSIRKIAAKFDETIQKNAEAVIAKYTPLMEKVVEQYRPKLEGKKVMLYVGGLRPRHTIGAYEDLGMEVVASGYEFGHNDDYKRTYPELKEGAVIMDDATLYELEEFTRRLKPDMVGSGIKEKYSYHKLGVPFRQMHSWDYSGPYHGFDGFPVFARDMDMTVNSPTWGLIRRKK
jgi:nitrogenase molybdenum-iron protein alpha chain